jgi:DNA topoisomerase-1
MSMSVMGDRLVALQTKIGHVHDTQYWHLPEGTPIVAGVKPSERHLSRIGGGTWGASRSGSYGIAGASAEVMGIPGYRVDREDSYLGGTYANRKRWAKAMLRRIKRSPGVTEPMYHGTRPAKYESLKVGDSIDLPLVATTGSHSLAVGFADERDKPTGMILEFLPGTKMVGYSLNEGFGDPQLFDPEHPVEETWDEAITAGRFEVVRRYQRPPYGYRPDEEQQEHVVLRQTHIYDLATQTWVEVSPSGAAVKDLAIGVLEQKARLQRVRTAEGARRYKLPRGSVIVRGTGQLAQRIRGHIAKRTEARRADKEIASLRKRNPKHYWTVSPTYDTPDVYELEGHGFVAYYHNDDGTIDIGSLIATPGAHGVARMAVELADRMYRGKTQTTDTFDHSNVEGYADQADLTLDAFETVVPVYKKLGFVETKRIAFSDEYAPPGWKPEYGRPDIVYMRRAPQKTPAKAPERPVAGSKGAGGTPEGQKALETVSGAVPPGSSVKSLLGKLALTAMALDPREVPQWRYDGEPMTAKYLAASMDIPEAEAQVRLETKRAVARVHDPSYWHLPVGTPIRERMKPPAQVRPEAGPEVTPVVSQMHPATEASRAHYRQVTGRAIPPAWTDVHIAADLHNAKLLVQGRDAKGRRQSLYSAAHTESQAAVKFARIMELDNHLDKLDHSLDRDAADNDHAAALLLIRRLGMRPGSESDTGAEKHAHGATNLRVGHAHVDGDRIRFNFTGKDGVQIHLDVEDAQIARVIEVRQKGRGPDDRLFNTSAAKVSQYMQEAGVPKGLMLKDLRTLHANVVALQEIEARGDAVPRTKTEFRRWRKEVATVVSTQLGNTPTMAIKSYLNPAVWSEWVGDPSWL